MGNFIGGDFDCTRLTFHTNDVVCQSGWFSDVLHMIGGYYNSLASIFQSDGAVVGFFLRL